MKGILLCISLMCITIGAKDIENSQMMWKENNIDNVKFAPATGRPSYSVSNGDIDKIKEDLITLKNDINQIKTDLEQTNNNLVKLIKILKKKGVING